MSGMPATFEADRNELYKMQTIQMTSPTILDVSKETFDADSSLKKWWLHLASGLFATADHVKYTVYNVTTALCNNPELGKASCTWGNNDTTLTTTHNIKLIEIKNLFRPHESAYKNLDLNIY